MNKNIIKANNKTIICNNTNLNHVVNNLLQNHDHIIVNGEKVEGETIKFEKLDIALISIALVICVIFLIKVVML